MGWTFYNASGQRLQAFGFVAATQAEMEAGSSTTAYVTPGRTQHHPGVAKVFALFKQQGGGHSVTGTPYNIAGVSDGSAAGDTDLTWTVAFSSANYSIVSMIEDNRTVGMTNTMVAGGITLISALTADGEANIDSESPGICIACFGDQ